MAEPVQGVSVIVRRDGRFLLVRRSRQPFDGQLAFPGGRVEVGETLDEAARRELVEETCLRARSLKPVDNFPIETGTASFHLHVFRAEADGEARPGDDAASIHWLDLPEIEAQSESVTADTLRLARRFSSDSASDAEETS